MKLFIHENTSENIVYETAAILSRGDMSWLTQYTSTRTQLVMVPTPFVLDKLYGSIAYNTYNIGQYNVRTPLYFLTKNGRQPQDQAELHAT